MKTIATRLFTAVRRRLIDAPRGMGHPVPAEAFDREYATGHWNLLFSEEELPRTQILVGLIASLSPRPAVLDLGCGSGRLAQLLASHFPARYLGVDLSAEGLRRAQSLGLNGCEFVQDDFETWSPAGLFDAVVFNESIGYAHDPAAAVQRFFSCLNPGGRVLISYYRSGNHKAIWRRIARVAETLQETSARNRLGATWDVKLLRPRIAARPGMSSRVASLSAASPPADKISPAHP